MRTLQQQLVELQRANSLEATLTKQLRLLSLTRGLTQGCHAVSLAQGDKRTGCWRCLRTQLVWQQLASLTKCFLLCQQRARESREQRLKRSHAQETCT